MSLALANKTSISSNPRRKNFTFQPGFLGSKPIHNNFHQRLNQYKTSCPCGGGCSRCIGGSPVQPKLKINEPGDKYEQEANSVADQVMRMTDDEVLSPSQTNTNIQRKCAECSRGSSLCPECAEEAEGLQLKPLGSAITPILQRQAEIEEENEEELIQTKVDSGKNPETISNLGSQIQSLKGDGQPLAKSVLNYFEPRFGYDFGNVRIHKDNAAAESARSINARAYTSGNDIVFGSGQYNPATVTGKKLLAHELTHVLQQNHFSDINGGICSETILNGGVGWQFVQRDEAEAERRAMFTPRFPGCSPHDRIRLDYQLVRARNFVRFAIHGLYREIERTRGGMGIITMTGSALNRHFHTSNPDHIRTIISRLDRILSRLNRSPRNWRCVSRGGCWRECRGGSTTSACASTRSPVYLCPNHFEWDDVAGAITLVHEAAHQAGIPGDTYVWHRRYVSLTRGQALWNADSYAMFVRDNYLRGWSSRETWTARDMSILFSLLEPAVIGDFGYSEGESHQIPRRDRILNNRIRAEIFFFPDSQGVAERPRPYTPPEVSSMVTLIRAGNARTRAGRPRRSVLLDVTDPAARDQGAGTGLGTTFNNIFEFEFDPSDRGTLRIVISLRDFDTATTLTFRQNLFVRPTTP